MYKKTPILLVLALGVIAFMTQQSFGQAASAYQLQLGEMNQMKPLQNPLWQRSVDMMKFRILDRKNKVAGTLKDIIISDRGALSSLKVDLDRMQLNEEIFLGSEDLKFMSGDRAFVLQYDEAEMKDLYPIILNNLDTAAGSMSDSISLDSLLRADVRAQDGRNLGKVEEVLFSRNGGDASALLIRVRYRTIAGENVAIPFSSVSYEPDGKTFHVIIPNNQADDIIEFAGR